MHFIVIADVNENLGDPAQVANMGDLASVSNNRILVEEGPLSDLQVILPTTNISYQGGQPAMVTYQIMNRGANSAVGIWYEALYLSRDAILCPFDTRLRSVEIITTLESMVVTDRLLKFSFHSICQVVAITSSSALMMEIAFQS